MDFYTTAYKHMRKGSPDPQKSLKYLRKAYAQGDPRAAYALGTWYLFGENVHKNMRKAVSLFRYAARHHIPDALYDLAICYETGEGTKKSKRLAYECYVRAALNGHSQSIYEVGRCYYYGIGVKRDRRASAIWLDKAENVGVKNAQKIQGKAPTHVRHRFKK